MYPLHWGQAYLVFLRALFYTHEPELTGSEKKLFSKPNKSKSKVGFCTKKIQNKIETRKMLHEENPTTFTDLIDQAYQTVASALCDQDHYWNAKVDF